MRKLLAILIVFVISFSLFSSVFASPDIDMVDTVAEGSARPARTDTAQETGLVLIDVDLISLEDGGEAEQEAEKEKTYLDMVIEGSAEDFPRSEKQFPVIITNPKKESVITAEKSLLISGYTAEPNIRVVIAVYNPEKEIYEEIINEEGKRGIDIGVSGIFCGTVMLKEGENFIKVVAYDKTLDEEALKEEGKIQIEYFKITCLNESFSRKITETFIRIIDIFLEKLR